MTEEERALAFKQKWRLPVGWSNEMDLADLVHELLEPAVAEEREVCARIAAEMYGEGYAQQAGFRIASTIRARGLPQ